MYSNAEELTCNPFEPRAHAPLSPFMGLADPPLCGPESAPHSLGNNAMADAGAISALFAGMYGTAPVGIGAVQGARSELYGERPAAGTAWEACQPEVGEVDRGGLLHQSRAIGCSGPDEHSDVKADAEHIALMPSRQHADGELCETLPSAADASGFAGEQHGSVPTGPSPQTSEAAFAIPQSEQSHLGMVESAPHDSPLELEPLSQNPACQVAVAPLQAAQQGLHLADRTAEAELACEQGALEPRSVPAPHESSTPGKAEGTESPTPHKEENASAAQQTPLSKTILRVAKFTSDLMRLPAGLKEAGKYGLQKGAPIAAEAWHQVGRAGAAGEAFIARHLPSNAGRWVENTKNLLGYATLDPKTIMKHIGGRAKGAFTNSSKTAERLAGNALRRTLGKKSSLGRAIAGRGMEKTWPAAAIEHAVEKETARAEAKAGQTGGNFVERKLAAHAAKKAVMAETMRAAERAGILATEKGALQTGEKAAAKVVERVAVKEAASVGGKMAGKTLGKLIPGLNVGVSIGAAGLDLKEVFSSLRKRNYTGAAIEGVHAATDLAGVIPGIGGAVSLLGDALSIGAHWLTGR